MPRINWHRTITRGYLTAFLDLHLRHLPQPLLDGPTRANLEVTFHNPHCEE